MNCGIVAPLLYIDIDGIPYGGGIPYIPGYIANGGILDYLGSGIFIGGIKSFDSAVG
jgi:hypothetical protein